MFRWKQLTWFSTALLAATSAVISGVEPTATAAADPGIFVAPNPAAGAVSEGMLEALQRDLKVTPQQARERLVRSDWASRLDAQLRPRLGSAFAGSWLAEDGYEYVVAITDRRHEPLVRASGATPKLVARSLAELTAIGDKLDKRAQGGGKVPDALASWTVDPQKGQVTVEHLPGGRAAAEAFVAAAGVARDVVYAVVPQRFQQHTDLKAGEGIAMREVFENGTFRARRCSAGFAVQDRQTGRLGFMTSAHCWRANFGTVHVSPPRFPADGDNFGANYVGSVVRALFGGSDDEAFVRMRPAPPLWNPVAFVKGYKQPDVPVHDGTEQLPGSLVCRSGITTGMRCGKIISGEGYVVYSDGSVVSHLKQTDTCAEPGDSGGPVVSGVHAQGLHTGANPLAEVCLSVINFLARSFYVPVQRALGALDLALGTTTAAPTTPPRPTPPPTPLPNQKWFTGKQVWGGLGGAVKGKVASVTLGPGHVQIFGQGTDNKLYTNSSIDGVWGGWQNLGDVVTEPPTVLARTGGVIDVLYRGSDTRPYVRRWNGSAWESPVKLGDIDVTGPIAAVPLFGGAHAALFIRSSNDEVYFAGHDGTRWGSWTALGGDVNEAPTAIARPNAAGQMILEVYARWADDNVRYRRTDPSQPGFQPWVNLGGIWGGTPVGVTIGVDHSFLVGVGRDDKTLQMQQFRNGDWLRGSNGSITTGWRGVGGSVYSQPAVIAGPGERVRVLARDVNQQVNSIAWLGGDIRNWERWSSLGGDTGAPIGAQLRTDGQFGVIDAFGIDAATGEPLHTAIEAAPVPVNVAPNEDEFMVGDAGFFLVTGPPGAPISWSSTKDGVPRENHAFYGQYLDASGSFTASADDWDATSTGSWVKQVHVGTETPQTAQVGFTVTNRPATISTDKGQYLLGENVTFMITGPPNQPISAWSTLNGRPSGVNPAFHGQYTDASGVFTMTVPWTDPRLGFWTTSVNIAGQPAQVTFAVSNGSLAIYTESDQYGFGSFINYMVAGPPNQPTFWTTWINGSLQGQEVPGQPTDADGLLVTEPAPWINFRNGTYVVQVRVGAQTAQVSFVFDWPQPVYWPQITAQHSNKCLDIEGNTVDDGARASQATCVYGVNTWRRSGPTLIAVESGKCLEVTPGNTAGAPTYQWACNGSPQQEWEYVSATPEWWLKLYKIVSVGSGMCLTVADASPADGAAIVQMPCTGSANQIWHDPGPIFPAGPAGPE